MSRNVLRRRHGVDSVFKCSNVGASVSNFTMQAGNTDLRDIAANLDGSKPTGITLDPSSGSKLWVVDEYANGRTLTSGTGTVSNSFELAGTNLAPQGIADPVSWVSLPEGEAASAYDEAPALRRRVGRSGGAGRQPAGSRRHVLLDALNGRFDGGANRRQPEPGLRVRFLFARCVLGARPRSLARLQRAGSRRAAT